jgi:general secretion pathway protein C
MKRFATILMHLALLALVCAAAAYWIAKIATPAPTPAPPPVASPPPRDVDPVLAARMFGLVQLANTQVTANVQVSGVFAAGDRSSAVLVVDGKPARAYLVGQQIAPGLTLAEVRHDGVTLESGGGRQDVRVPPRPVANMGGAPPPPNFTRQGNVLSAPSAGQGGGAAPYPPPAMPMPPQPVPSQPLPPAPDPRNPPPGSPMPTQTPAG